MQLKMHSTPSFSTFPHVLGAGGFPQKKNPSVKKSRRHTYTAPEDLKCNRPLPEPWARSVCRHSLQHCDIAHNPSHYCKRVTKSPSQTLCFWWLPRDVEIITATSWITPYLKHYSYSVRSFLNNYQCSRNHTQMTCMTSIKPDYWPNRVQT